MAVVQWVTGAPLWKSAAAGDGAGMRHPVLLRLASDQFMDDLAAILAADPAGLTAHIARPLTFRPVPPGAPPNWSPAPRPLKLYQPLHGDFNLVAASLVCRLTGLPDHTVKAGEGEQTAFVLRRVQPDGTELAWAPGDTGAKSWLPVGTGSQSLVADHEELFPLFPVAYAEQAPGGTGTRRLLIGLVPVSSRETFRAASSVEPFPDRGPAGGTADDDPRWNAFDVRVIGPLTALQDKTRPIPGGLAAEASANVLLDFADMLKQNVPAVWNSLQGGAAPATGTAADRLRALLTADPGVPWPSCLVAALNQWDAITGESTAPVTLDCDLRNAAIDPNELQRRFRDAVPGTPPPSRTPADLPVPKIEPTGEARYLIRCVYRRPACAPFTTDLVSEPSETFAIAPVLDPDAPARQIRIPLPMDTSVKDFRKFPKSVGFILSNQLRGQMNRVTDLKKALDGGLGSEEHWDLGVICQFSIPIITICALILLIAIVFVLNIVFFWAAFFRICLPVPVRSKEGS